MERELFDVTLQALKQRFPRKPFTVVMMNGNRFEVDHAEAVVYRDGMAIFAAPGGVPVIFDHDGVSEIVGDLAQNNPGA